MRNLKIIMIIIWVSFISLVLSMVLLIRWYNLNLKPVDRSNTNEQVFVVVRGETVDQIAENLEAADLIRDASAFKWYIRLNHRQTNFYSGNFTLSPSFYVSKIVKILSSGVASNLNVTIPSEKNLVQIQESLIDQGFSPQDVREALQPSNYVHHNLIKDNIIPRDASLEGYIVAETHAVNQFNSASVKDIIQRSLDLFETEYLTEDIRNNLPSDLTLHQVVTLASIVELEARPEDRAKVAQVFLKRLRQNIALGSDVTFFYAADIGNYKPHVDDPSPYNTRIHKGLPPGPISNVSRSSLQAVINPADTNYLYFVAGDDGVMYFNETLSGHNRDAELHCDVNCRLP